MIAATDPATGRALSDDEIRDELVVFMFAGHDTTATTLTYALWALGHHPEIQDRVRAEVAAIGDRELTPEDVPALGYTVQVLHEALRLCPPAAATGRTAMRDIKVDGYRVEAGTMLVVGIYALHRDPALWDHPLVFDPDRFSPQNSAGRDRWQYLPVRRRAAILHRRSLRHARSHPRTGHHHPAHRNPVHGRGFPDDHAVHHRRRSTNPGPLASPELTLASDGGPDHGRRVRRRVIRRISLP